MLNWLEVDLSAVAHNIAKIKERIGKQVKFCAVVKANAYGHGLLEIANASWNNGADYFAVASLDEAMALRQYKVFCPILVFGWVAFDELKIAAENDLTLSLYNLSFAKAASRELEKKNRVAKFHVKVDTGMHRLGVLAEQAESFMHQVSHLPCLKIEGLYSHFAEAANAEYSKMQMQSFQNLLFKMQMSGIPRPALIHMANSAGALTIPASRFDMVRCGIAMYGLSDALLGRKSALSFKTKIMQVKDLPKDAYVGYGRTYKTKKSTKIAILGVGYSDGFSRGLSNCGQVLIGGRRCEVIGRVCMNQTIVEIPDGLFPQSGDEVVLIGKQGNEEISAIEIAQKLDTVPHEIVARIPSSVPRIYKN